jgi:hypothetical protein
LAWRFRGSGQEFAGVPLVKLIVLFSWLFPSVVAGRLFIGPSSWVSAAFASCALLLAPFLVAALHFLQDATVLVISLGDAVGIFLKLDRDVVGIPSASGHCPHDLGEFLRACAFRRAVADQPRDIVGDRPLGIDVEESAGQIGYLL